MVFSNLKKIKIVQFSYSLDPTFFAHKKGGGSSKNGRDSKSKRLGCKAADGQLLSAGSIIFRQRGTKIYPGKNVGIGNDHTLYALKTGYVKFQNRTRKTKKVSIFDSRT